MRLLRFARNDKLWDVNLFEVFTIITMKKTTAIHPVYFLYGVEDYLIQDEVKRLMDQILPPQERGLNLHVFSGEEHGGQEILQTAQTLPMFSKYRFVLVNKADQLDEKEMEGFLKYIQRPSPSTCLVLCAQDSGPWKKHLAKIEEIGVVIEHPRLKGKGLTSWIRKRMEEKKKTLSEEAANYLIEVIGDHLQDLDNALETIFLSTGDQRTIGLPDIEGVLSDVKVSTIFELTDAIGQQNLEKALAILRKVLGSKILTFKKEEEASRHDDPSPLLLSMMARQYRLIWRVKEMAGRKQGIEEMAKNLRMSAWNVKKLLDQARRFSEPSLKEGLLKCQKTDLALKKGRGPRDLLLEKLVIDLCRPDKKAQR
jgi:DNA polymerase-3 subunit delta